MSLPWCFFICEVLIISRPFVFTRKFFYPPNRFCEPSFVFENWRVLYRGRLLAITILWTFRCFWKPESALPGQTVGHYALCPLRFEKHTLGRYHSLSLFYKDRNKLANAGDVRKVRYCFSSQSARVSNIWKQKTTTGNWLYHPAYFFSFSLSPMTLFSRAHELCESRGGLPGLPVRSLSLMVSVDVKQQWTELKGR